MDVRDKVLTACSFEITLKEPLCKIKVKLTSSWNNVRFALLCSAIYRSFLYRERASEREREGEIDWLIDWLIDWTLLHKDKGLGSIERERERICPCGINTSRCGWVSVKIELRFSCCLYSAPFLCVENVFLVFSSVMVYCIHFHFFLSVTLSAMNCAAVFKRQEREIQTLNFFSLVCFNFH